MRTSRRLAGAAAAVLLAGLGVWLLIPERVPMEWPGKASFCAEAATFEVANQDHITGEQRLAAARAMAAASPEQLREDLHVLVGDLAPESEPHSHVSAEQFQQATTRVGEFVERACGLNLPSIRT